jgi:oligosaccharide repeat unit polymerase
MLRPATAASLFALAAVAVFAAGAAWLAVGHPLTMLALCVSLVALVPVALNAYDFDVFAPWNYLFYFVLLNVLARSILLDLDLGRDVIDFRAVFYRDQTRDFLVWCMGLMLVGFVFLVVGYLLPKRRPLPLDLRIFVTDSFYPVRMRRTVLVLLLVSLLAVIGFVVTTFSGLGEFTWRMISAYRGISNDLDEYRGYGYLRLLVGFSSLAAYFAYVQKRLNPSRRQRRFYGRLVWVAILISALMAFYTQSRAALVYTFLNIVFIKYYLDGRRLPWRMMIGVAPIVILLFVVTSALRAGSGISISERVGPMNVVAPILLTNGGIDASKTGHIINYVDSTQEYKLGQTLVQFTWAVVPRELWPAKPPNLDTEIGTKVYDATTFGSGAVPPGFFGEMYMNFSYAGIVAGALFLGMLIKLIENLLAGNRGNANFILCYVLLLQQIGLSVMGSGVSSTIIGTLSVGIPLLIALFYVTPRRKKLA